MWFTTHMNSTRMFVLGALIRGGPMHGHQIRRAAQLDRTELWTDIQQGALYGALHRMSSEGVIEVVRTEQEGRMPARTIYAVTEAGRQEFYALRQACLQETKLRPDPVDLALHHAEDLTDEELRSFVLMRRGKLASELAALVHLEEVAKPHLRGIEPLVLDHSRKRLVAEIEWHDELLAALPGIRRE